MNDELSWGQIWPSRENFLALARDHRVIPVVKRVLIDDATPVGLYRLLAKSRPGTFLLESVEQDGVRSRWSYIGVRSRALLLAREGEAQWRGEIPQGILNHGPAIEVLASALAQLKTPRFAHLPPLTGGLIGALGWEIVAEWEPQLRYNARREIDVPDVSLCLVDDLLAIDHNENVVWLVANAINHNGSDDGADAAYDRATERLDEMFETLSEQVTLHPNVCNVNLEQVSTQVQFRTNQPDFEESVSRAKTHIVDGDVFQVVISQRQDVECNAAPLDVYRVLRTINPSPYMYYLQLENLDDESGFAVVGASPETLMKLDGTQITTFPIAGSRPRGADTAADKALEQELLADPKECSEHIMLVDLARNDLAKVAVPGSVHVQELMAIKKFSHIMHITSTVAATLREDKTAVDCLKATFPAGTLSGAPKPRAIEIIDSLEPAQRGIYGGVVGYFDFSGNADLAIAIRTAVIKGKYAHIQAGAGIVADSDPSTEFEETRNKAAAVVRAVHIANSLK